MIVPAYASVRDGTEWRKRSSVRSSSATQEGWRGDREDDLFVGVRRRKGNATSNVCVKYAPLLEVARSGTP